MPLVRFFETSFSRSADDQPLYTIEPVAPSVSNLVAALGGAAPMRLLANRELQNKSGANASQRSTRHIEVQLPPGAIYRVALEDARISLRNPATGPPRINMDRLEQALVSARL